jgi:hypothetical protein
VASFFQLLPDGLADRCRALAQEWAIEDETEQPLAENKGVMHRVRFGHHGESVVRTEVRTVMVTRVIVDAKPMGAVLIVLEVAKRNSGPSRLVALTGGRAGEYALGAIEAAWGALILEPTPGGPALGQRVPGSFRKLSLKEVISLAEAAL